MTMAEVEAVGPDLIGNREWQRLLGAAAHTRYPCRDRSLLHLFWHLGATVRQVSALEVDSVDLRTGALVWPDGRESRIPAEALQVLNAYVSLERDRRCPRLFSGRHGRPLTPADIDRCFRCLSRFSGLRVDPLTLRRSALLRLLLAAPLRALALRPDRGAAPERLAAARAAQPLA